MVVVLTLVGVGVLIAVQRLRIFEFEEAARLVRRGVQPATTPSRGTCACARQARRSPRLTDMPAVFEALGQVFAAEGAHARKSACRRRSWTAGPDRARRPAPAQCEHGGRCRRGGRRVDLAHAGAPDGARRNGGR